MLHHVGMSNWKNLVAINCDGEDEARAVYWVQQKLNSRDM